MNNLPNNSYWGYDNFHSMPLDGIKPNTEDATRWVESCPLFYRANKSYDRLSIDRTKTIEYNFNGIGCRGDGISEWMGRDKTLLTFGCSHTEGVGLTEDKTWSYMLAQDIEASYINYGRAAQSNDYICRAVLSVTERLKPDVVAILFTYPHRREVYREDGLMNYYVLGSKDKPLTLHQNDYSDEINRFKNFHIIKNHLNNLGIKFLYSDIDFYEGEILDKSVDGMHYGEMTNRRLADKLYSGYQI